MRAQAIFLIFLSALSACSRKEVAKPVEESKNNVAKPVATASAYADIRSIDFRNFDYPKIPGEMETEIHLRNGVHKNLFPEDGQEADSPWNGEAELDQVIYHIDEQAQPIAFVIVTVFSGGQMYVSEIFLYGMVDHKPELLWSFESGDRADGGLRTLYFQSGSGYWVLELYQESAGDGLCCASHFSRRFYDLRGGKLVEVGRQEWIPVPKQPNRNRSN
jgi:hypothetical protein